ncbi:unnamed protein product [Prunus armeniaca]
MKTPEHLSIQLTQRRCPPTYSIDSLSPCNLMNINRSPVSHSRMPPEKKKKKDLPIRTVLREVQGGNQKRPSGDIFHKKRTSKDTRCAKNSLRRYPGSYPFSKGGRIVIKRHSRLAARKKRPSGDAGFARIVLRELPISNVLRQTQPTRSFLLEMQGALGIS